MQLKLPVFEHSLLRIARKSRSGWDFLAIHLDAFRPERARRCAAFARDAWLILAARHTGLDIPDILTECTKRGSV